MTFTLKATYDKTKPGVALVPPEWWSQGKHGKAQYVRLSKDRRSESLQVDERSGASGTEIWVSPDTLNLSKDSVANVTITEISKSQFRSDHLFKSRDGWFALGGLIVTIAGLAVPLAFSFGDSFFVVCRVAPQTKSILLWLSPAFGIAGVLLVFIRGVWLRGG